MRRFTVLLSLLVLCGLVSRASAAVVLSYTETYANVYDGSSYVVDDLFTSPTAVASASVPGYSSTTGGAYFTAGDSASLSGTFLQSREGGVYNFVRGFVTLAFVPDASVPYTASGAFSHSDGFTEFYSYLYDNTTSTYLYYSQQDSSGAPAAFTLGETAGNYFNSMSGSLTGTLVAGDTYYWITYAFAEAYPVSDSGGEASGYTSLTIGESAVPESSSVIVWSLLALTMCGACWWRKTALIG